MDLVTFERSRSSEWAELRQLIARGGAASPIEVLRRGALYRGLVADLAFARRRFPDESLRADLETLALAARHSVYSRQQVDRRAVFKRWVTRGFWQRVRERPGALALSAATLFIPAILIGVWSVRDPESASRFIPGTSNWAGPKIEGVTDRGIAALEIMLNNIRVTLICAAGGALAGIGAGGALAFNGVFLGSVVGLAIANGNGQAALEWIPAHGGIELSCIVIAGAAGYRLGAAIIAPGAKPRRQAVAEEGRGMIQTVGGVSLLLVLAGLIEGFISPAYLGTPFVMTIGIATAAALWCAVVVLGRPDDEAVPEAVPLIVQTPPAASAHLG